MNYTIIIISIILLLIISYVFYYYGFNKITTPLIKNDNNESNNEEETINKINDIKLKPYFDISINNNEVGRVKFELFDDEVPKTCKNFRYLCALGFKDNGDPAYKNCIIHRVIKDFMIQTGDITNNNGTGGFSIYGDKFDDENFNLKHNQKGLLSMANSGPNTNNSQFFITTNKTEWLDNKHVVFGIVLSGYDIIEQIQNVEKDENDKPIYEVKIINCGLE